ncbi:MAG: GTPase [Rhodospirillales bacterium]
MKNAAERMVDLLLPVRLRLDPRWLAAGAAGGALACVAAAGLVALVAIASPARLGRVGWRRTDGASAQRGAERSRPRRRRCALPARLTSACRFLVDAAALFAMLLELQGRNEALIGRGSTRRSAPRSTPRRLRMHKPSGTGWMPCGRASRGAGGGRDEHGRGHLKSGRPPLIVAVVGHTNTGKTSLIRTLTPDAPSAKSPTGRRRRATSRARCCWWTASRWSSLYDTPGLEDPMGLLEHLEPARRAPPRLDRGDPRRVPRRAASAFAQEAKAIRQLLASDVALYVVDVRDRVLGKHRDELKSSAAAPGRRCRC